MSIRRRKGLVKRGGSSWEWKGRRQEKVTGKAKKQEVEKVSRERRRWQGKGVEKVADESGKGSGGRRRTVKEGE